MGTYYGLGVIKNLSATSKENKFLETEWRRLLSERIDMELFDIIFYENIIKANLKNIFFENNIEDFYVKLKKITTKESVSSYFKEYGTRLEDYPSQEMSIYLRDNGKIVTIEIEAALLFIEGKVLAEEFNIEPLLINWLFKNSNFGNPLAGCVVSNIIG